jgi:hypothetical protein
MLEKMLWFLETPRKERKAARIAKRESWSYRWFGMVPLSMKIAVKKTRLKRR